MTVHDIEAALEHATTPEAIGQVFERFAPELQRLARFDQAILLACERNPDWITAIAQYPWSENTVPTRPAREVGNDAVGSFSNGIEFVPAESGTGAGAEMAAAGITRAWACPMFSHGRNHGMLSVSRRKDEKFGEEELALLRSVTRAFARRLGSLWLRASSAQERSRRELVSEVCRWPDGDEEPQELFTRLFGVLAGSVPVEGVVLVSIGKNGAQERQVACGDQQACTHALSVLAALAGRDDEGSGVFEVGSNEPGAMRTVVAPLRRGTELIGILSMARRSGIPLSTPDLSYLGFFSTVLAQALVSRIREAQLRAAEQRYQHLFQSAPAMYAIVSLEGPAPVVVDCNDLFLETLGYQREDVVGEPLSKFDPSERRTGPRRLRLLANDEERFLLHRNGQPIDTLMRTTPEFGPNGEILNLCAMYIDVSERNGLQRQLAHQAFHDSLTDLPNRALFLDRLGQALRRNAEVAVALLDLDDFKVVNDSLGHASGDDLLVAVARRLRDFLMPADTIARMGGDEFTILLEEPGSVEGAMARMEALAQAFEVPFRLGEREVFVDASIGLIVEATADFEPEELLRRADVAMYEAKRRGKGGVQLFDSSFQDLARHRLDLETDLRTAIESGQIVNWYQPVIDLATGDLAEMEALARWAHPTRGILPPSEFIDLAENSGLIVSLGREVLRRACIDAKRWIEEYDLPDTFRVAVNASVRQLERPRIVEEVLAVLEEVGLSPRHLKLEVTESLMLAEGDGAVAKLERLVAAGVGIAIDDFGTGYSSLSYLKRLPVDTVKIDRSFVSGIEVEIRDTAIVQAVVAFAESIGLTVTVEGVESSSQVEAVRGLGCDRGQGYYFSRPLPAEGVAPVFRRKRQAA